MLQYPWRETSCHRIPFMLLLFLSISYILVQEWYASNYLIAFFCSYFGITLHLIMRKSYKIVCHGISLNALSAFLHPLYMDLNYMIFFLVRPFDILHILKTFSPWKLLIFNFFSLPSPTITIKMMPEIIAVEYVQK